MSRLFVSNKVEIVEQLSNISKSSGFSILANYKEDINIVTFQKKNINNINYIRENNSFIAAIGTLIYKGKSSTNALSLILENYNGNGDINKIKKEAVGSYAVIIIKDKETILFGDSSATLDIFYHQHAGKWVISNILYDMSKLKEFNLIINKYNLLEEFFQNTIIGDETIFNDVYRLAENEYIEINNDKITIHTDKSSVLSPSKLDYSYSKCVECISSKLSEYAELVDKNYGESEICMTGGLDARMTLASFLSAKTRPNLFYGVGDSPLTNTKNTDKQIVDLISKNLNLEKKIQDWSTPNPFDKYWDQYIRQYGFLASLYMASDKVFESFEKLKTKFITFGYFGELYRNLPWVELNHKTSFTVQEYIDEYYLTKDATLYLKENLIEYKNHLIKKLNKICKKYSLDPYNIPIEANQYFLFEYRKNADTRMLNLLNQICYSFYFLSQKEVLELSFVSINEKKKSRFMIHIIEKLDNHILDYPIFSHTEKRYYNRKKACLSVSKIDIIKKYTKHFSGYIPKSPKRKLKKWIVGEDIKTSSDLSRETIIRDRIDEILNKNKLNEENTFSTKLIDIRRFSKMAFYFYCLNN